jgi:hypothetical protein
MRNAFLAVAIALVLAGETAPLALAGGKVEKTYTPQKPDGTSERGPASGNTTGSKSLTTTANPAFQGNVLKKGGSDLSPPKPQY